MNLHLDRAGVLLQQGRYDLVAREVSEALTEDADNAMAHAYLALAYMYLNDGYTGLAAAVRAVALAPDFGYVHYVHATVLLEQDQLAAAQAAIAEALRLAPFEADYFAQAALIWLAGKDAVRAETAADEGLSRDPRHVVCANVRALALLQQGRDEEAAAAVEHALSFDASNALTFTLRGCVCLNTARPAEATAYFREALRLEPRHRIAREGLLAALRSRTWPRRVLQQFARWLDRGFHAHPLLLLASAAAAFAALRRAADLGHPWVWGVLAALYAGVFFGRTAGSLFRISFLLHRTERRLVPVQGRVAAQAYAMLAGMGVLCAVAGASRGSPLAWESAFACLILAATLDHLEPTAHPPLQRAVAAGVQAVRIGGMAALLIGYYVSGIVALALAVAAFHWLEEWIEAGSTD